MAVNRFATNNLVAEHGIYVKYLEIRKKFEYPFGKADSYTIRTREAR